MCLQITVYLSYLAALKSDQWVDLKIVFLISALQDKMKQYQPVTLFKF